MFAFTDADHLVGDGLGGYVERIACAGGYGERAGDAFLGDVGYVGACLSRALDGVGYFTIVGDGGVEITCCGESVFSDGYGIVLVEGGKAGIEGHSDDGILGCAEMDGDGLGAADAEGKLGGGALVPGSSVLRRGAGSGEGISSGGDDGAAFGEGHGLIGDGGTICGGSVEGVGVVGDVAGGAVGDFGEYLHILEVKHNTSGRGVVVRTGNGIVLASGESACGQKDGCPKAMYRASSFHSVGVKVPSSIPSH